MTERAFGQLVSYLEKERERFADLSFRLREPLASHSSFRIGGEAAAAVFPASSRAMGALLSFLREEAIPHAVFGKGTNLLFSDAGYDGVALFTGEMRKTAFDGSHVRAEAGVPITALASEAQKRGLSGLEFAYGIPGSVGGAVYMNAGAYGGEIASVLESSLYYDVKEGKTVRLKEEEHRFSYRESFYSLAAAKESAGGSRIADGTPVILEASFTLTPDDPEAIRQRMEDFMRRRTEKQPLEFPSAGSTFRRPDGYFAGKLISDAGLRGCRVGGAAVSEKHAGFVINTGGATAADVKALIAHIQKTVEEKFGVKLRREVIYFGDE